MNLSRSRCRYQVGLGLGLVCCCNRVIANCCSCNLLSSVVLLLLPTLRAATCVYYVCRIELLLPSKSSTLLYLGNGVIAYYLSSNLLLL